MSVYRNRTILWRNSLTSLSGIQEDLAHPDFQAIVIPDVHWQALDLNSTIVTGDRGTGKSFWTSVLYSRECRQFIADIKKSHQIGNLEVCIGFSIDQENHLHPNSDELKALSKANIPRDSVWKAVILKNLRKLCIEKEYIDKTPWLELSREVEEKGGEFGAELASLNKSFAEKGTPVLIVFDALDRLADEWPKVREWATPALRLALEMRSYSHIRTKFFLRTDMAEDDKLWSFQDSSKLKHNKIELLWKKMDLFTIILRHLANDSESGESYRATCRENRIIDFDYVKDTFIEKSNKTSQEDSIKEAVQLITGKYMGSGAKRGLCYSWIPVHLADAKGNSSPRSMQKTIREAALHTVSQYSEHNLPLHYEAIKYGVARASTVRVDELKEDYPWIEPLLHSLEGQTVPVEENILAKLWKNPMKELGRQERLPPRRYTSETPQSRQLSSLLDDLEELGVLYKTHDKRINIPDIYRVGHRIGRKGGVKPIR